MSDEQIRLEDAEIERILAMSDEEILAEARREGLNPELEARYLRRLAANAVEMVKLRERAEKSDRHYMAAVHDRVQFRAGLRETRARLDRLQAERERLRAALDAYPDSDLAALALTLRTRSEGLEARAERDRALVAAALAWLPEHAEYTAGCATCERLVEAARAHREAQ